MAGDTLGLKDMMNVTDGPEFVGVAHGAIVDDGKVHGRSLVFVGRSPLFECLGELIVRDDVDPVDVWDRSEIIEDPLDHRFAGNFQKRLGLVLGEGIEAGGVTGG